VGTKSFKHTVWPKGMAFTVPNTRVGRKGKVTEIEFEGQETPNFTEDYGLDGVVPNEDIAIAEKEGLPDPVLVSAEFTTELVALDREVRTANLVFAAGTYDAGSKLQLAGNDRWDVAHADSQPIDDIQDALDTRIMRPNTMVLGHKAASKLLRHPVILKGFHGSDGDKGKATLSYLAELFELESVWVGRAFFNTAKKGAAPNIVRAWGNHCALLHLNPKATPTQGTTYGYTAQFGPKVGGNWEDKNIGLKGGQKVRVGESVREVVTAADLGFLLQDVVS